MIKKILPFYIAFVIIFTPPLLVLGADPNGITTGCNTGDVIKKPAEPAQPERIEMIDGVATVIPAKPAMPERYEYANPCNFNGLMESINKVINFVLFVLATPLFALIIIYVAWLYLSDMGSAENVKKAKKIFKNVVIGYVIALAAWLIVKTILSSLGFSGPMFLFI